MLAPTITKVTVNIGVGEVRGLPPHVTGEDFRKMFAVPRGGPLADALAWPPAAQARTRGDPVRDEEGRLKTERVFVSMAGGGCDGSGSDEQSLCAGPSWRSNQSMPINTNQHQSIQIDTNRYKPIPNNENK